MIDSVTTYLKYVARTLFTLLSIVLALNIGTTFAQQELSVFSYVDQSADGQNTLSSGLADSVNLTEQEGVATWNIALNEQASSLTKGDVLQIPLPSGQILNATINERKLFKNGDVQLLATSGSDGRIILTIGSKAVFGSIVSASEGVNFSISFDGNTGQILIDQDSLPGDAFDFTDDFIELNSSYNSSPRALETSAQVAETAATETDGKTNIDMLFVVSPEFEALFGSAETRINQLISFTNQAYDDTGILINLRVADAVELPIDNSATVRTLLDGARLSSGNTGFDDVSELRDQTGADLVAVLTTSTSNFSANGVAFIGGNRQDLGFSSTKLGLFCCDIVFAHEIGHNLGSGHQRDELNLDGISPCTGGFTDFSCGHASIVFEPGSTDEVDRSETWGTIMASGSSIPRINLFSNLDQSLESSCNDVPCGVAAGNTNAADNLTSFNFTRIAISQFRDEVIPVNTNFLPALFNILFDKEKD